ncbi:hypothetical protein Leryth_014182, partial [Lithospermum erythrorhizon]
MWLRSNGSVSGNGTSSNPLRSSLLLSDDSSSKLRKIHQSSNDQNLGPNRDEPFWEASGVGITLTHWGIIHQLGLRGRSLRSHSTVSESARNRAWPRKSRLGSKIDKGLLHKVSFERDFPSLGVEEKLAASEIRRVPSPSLSSSIHSFAVAAPAMMGNDKWMSALAEVPGMIKSHETGISSAKVAAPGSPYMAPSISTGLSMAETVAQGPPRVQTPLLSTDLRRQGWLLNNWVHNAPSPQKLLTSPAPESSLIISATGKKLDEGEGEGEDATSPVTNQSGEVGILANIKSSETRNYINSKPSWKILQGMPRFLLALESQIGSVAGISSGLNSSNSKLE